MVVVVVVCVVGVSVCGTTLLYVSHYYYYC